MRLNLDNVFETKPSKPKVFTNLVHIFHDYWFEEDNRLSEVKRNLKQKKTL